MSAAATKARDSGTAIAEHKAAPPPAIAAAADQSPVMAMIQAAAQNPDFDAQKLEKLVAMAERENAKRAETAFNVALSQAQKAMTRISADAVNNGVKGGNSKYVTYAKLDRVLRPIYTQHGFSLSFDTAPDAPQLHVRVLCHVSHVDGHTRTYRADIPCDGKGAQGGDVMTKTHAVGSAMTYGSRYLLKLIFNVAVGEDDDDGNAAGGGNDPLTPEMLDELTNMLAQCNGDPELFCKYMKVEAMAEIRQKDMGKAREALNGAIDEYQRNHPKPKGKS